MYICICVYSQVKKNSKKTDLTTIEEEFCITSFHQFDRGQFLIFSKPLKYIIGKIILSRKIGITIDIKRVFLVIYFITINIVFYITDTLYLIHNTCIYFTDL